jgi:flagellar basal-body rod protein FlgF
MDAASYTTLTRQAGLMGEMQVVANNLANISTTGFRREGVIFSEYVRRLENDPSLSMALGNSRQVDLSQADINQTGGSLDLAIQGDGFFLIETPDGQALTRTGVFNLSPTGEIVTHEGFRLLDEGGSPVLIAPNAKDIAVSNDGTISVDGQPSAKLALWAPADPTAMRHQAGTRFTATELQPLDGGVILQGFLEDSNVEPVSEIARMIEVQRAYELGQKFLDSEDQRMRGVIQTLGR